MEFWGVEVKHGVPLHVDPGEDMIVHISLVALGENKNNGNEPIRIYLNAGDKKLIIGTLSHDKFPQLSTEIVLEKRFELSHSWKKGSVFFSGYRVDASDPEDAKKTDNERAVTGNKAVKQVNFQVPNEDIKAKQEDDDDDSDEDSPDDDDEISSSEDSGDEEEKKVTAEVDSDEDDEDDSSDDDDEDESSEDDTPKKTDDSKKRVAEATTSKNPVSNKKAKFVTPQKSEESKKPHVHIATPHPSKQAGKNSGGSNGEASKQQQTPKPAGAFGCKSCNRTFTSEMGLQSHTKAKHSAAA